MGGKKAPPEKSKKAENKVKEKIIEDKTFGLKNKNKSAAVQKYIKGVQQQVKGVPKGGEQARLAAQLGQKEEKKKAQADQALLASLFKSVVELPKGQEAKDIICSYYKQGMCKKGDKCKFSHDLSSLPAKQEKFDLYHDPRSTTSDITCQFFLEAVEADKMGWFWKCPNGDECIYRHALPEGYIINREVVKEIQDDEDVILLEEEIDNERKKLPIGLKALTFEEFMKWIEENNRKREIEKQESRKHLKGITGRALFEADAGLFQDDEDAFEDYKRDENVQEEEEENKGIDSQLIGDVEEKNCEEEKKEEEVREEEKKEEDVIKKENNEEEAKKEGGDVEPEIKQDLHIEEKIPEKIEEKAKEEEEN